MSSATLAGAEDVAEEAPIGDWRERSSVVSSALRRLARRHVASRRWGCHLTALGIVVFPSPILRKMLNDPQLS